MAMAYQVATRGRYNELVCNYDPFVARLPRAVEAFFVLAGTPPDEFGRVLQVRAAFIREFELSEESAPPVVLYDPSLSLTAPFQLADITRAREWDAGVNLRGQG